jgi:hypothetical protein
MTLTCLMVMAGFQLFSSSRMERQTVPEGYTFGWKRGGLNLPDERVKRKVSAHSPSTNAQEAGTCGDVHFGGLVGYSSGNAMVNSYIPPSQFVYQKIHKAFHQLHKSFAAANSRIISLRLLDLESLLPKTTDSVNRRPPSSVSRRTPIQPNSL